MKILNHINWKIALFTALLLPVLISLGSWQLRREVEKRQMQALYESRQSALPVALVELDGLTQGELSYAPVYLQGQFDNAHSFLLDNRTHEGRQGMEVISPFVTEEEQVVMVNRGWIPRGQYREQLPEISQVPGIIRIQGNVYIPDGKAFMLGEETPFTTWPRVLQVADVGRMYDELGLADDARALPYTLRIQAGMQGAFGRYWQAINMSPEKHRGYAVQWFAMSAALLILFIYSIFRSVRNAQQKDNE